MLWNKNKLFCDINPTCYAISVQKGILTRHIRDFLSREAYTKTRQEARLPNLVSSHSSGLIKRGPGIDLTLQENKAVNIDLACAKMHGLLIRPGETFSFWRSIGKTTKRGGYKDGRVLVRNEIRPGIGGGLCNLGNTINLLVLHSPLSVTEFHSHSDALAPDGDTRVPFSSGTSVMYNYIDYRVKNNTDQTMQLLLWCADEQLHGELRSEGAFPWDFALEEEDHHFRKEGEDYYRISQIYKNTMDKATGAVVDKKLVLDNHSKVMYDHDLIKQELIRKD